MEVGLVSGQKVFNNMTSKLDGKAYAIIKANFWLHMLNDNQRPTRWLKANAKGTKVNFDFIKMQEEYDAGLLELEDYLKIIKKEYELDFKLNRN